MLLLLLSISSYGQESLTFLSYNVENLFDTNDDAHKNDSEFLPQGSKSWTEDRYQLKVKQIATVLDSTGADIIGLTEVENYKVLDDLINTEQLQPRQFQIIHQDSPDFRGIDVALIFDPQKFNYLKHETIPIHFPWDKYYRTRDILSVTGITGSDTLLIFVNHWPSRRGGQKVSDKNRMYVALVLRAKIEKIQKEHPAYHILVSGDFNDTPEDPSLKTVLAAHTSLLNPQAGELYIISSLLDSKTGSYIYRGKWYMYDQIIVNQKLLDGETLVVGRESISIYMPIWLREKPGKYEGYPWRTYAGKKYLGGYSDHFPVTVKLFIRGQDPH